MEVEQTHMLAVAEVEPLNKFLFRFQAWVQLAEQLLIQLVLAEPPQHRHPHLGAKAAIQHSDHIPYMVGLVDLREQLALRMAVGAEGNLLLLQEGPEEVPVEATVVTEIP